MISPPLARYIEALCCPACRGNLSPNNNAAGPDLHCSNCSLSYPVIDGIPRMLLPEMREALGKRGRSSQAVDTQAATARSFGYEWSRFPDMYDEWERNFLDYMAPRHSEFFRNKRVLDAGCGNGRHAYYAARFGAEVWAVDLGPAVEVARRNNAEIPSVHVIQADLYNLPFAAESFDFIYSIGVLHHLPRPEEAFQNLLRYLKPGGEIQIYLYWRPEGQPIKSALLNAVTAMRRLTTRLPHRVIYTLSYPAACAAFALFVWPYRLLRTVPGLKRLAESMPMKQYAHYPFKVCVNDQLDRFSAPVENRYTRAEVEAWFKRAGLVDVSVQPNFGWNGTGRKSRES